MEPEKETLNPSPDVSAGEIIKEMILKMGFSCELEEKKQENLIGQPAIYNIKTADSNFLIGQYGVNLQSLQHLARVLVRKKTQNRTDFLLDVNSYRQEKNDSIIKLAQNAAEQALSEKRPVVLRPMSPYERRLIHLELSRSGRIKTESIGEGENRKVVVKPADLI